MNSQGGASVAGDKLRETGTLYWTSPNSSATNSSGFTGRSTAYRLTNGTYFGSQKNNAYQWTATDGASASSMYFFGEAFNSSASTAGDSDKRLGYAVRCLKD
jgi:uncharacterized protein (TIGR02145 family)